MNENVDGTPLQAQITELEKQLEIAKGVVSILYHALDDASTVVDAGEDEDYAYQAELVAGAGFLGIERDSATRDKDVLNVLVVVTGQASGPDDESVPGVYGHEVTLSRSVTWNSLTPGEAGAIAQAVLDEFHERQGIKCLEDFEIVVQIKSGQIIAELDDTSQHESDLVRNVEHLNKVSDVTDAQRHEQPRG